MAIKVTVRKSSYNNIVPVRSFVRMPNMKEENERLFQENKDLRLSESHLRDELNIVRQQSEARRQIICERDKLIQELNEEVQASNDELENVQCDLVDHVKLQEEMCDTIDDLRIKLAKSESESSLGMSAMVKFWEEAVTEKNKAEERAEEYRIALMESDCRVDELEKRVEWLQTKNEEWAQLTTALKDTIAVQKEEKEALEDVIHAFEETRKDYEEEIHTQHVEKREWMQKYEELKAQKEADDKKCEETCAACNERYEDVLAERNRLREQVARLTDERNTAVDKNTEMMFDINELQDKWEAEHDLRAEAEKERDMYRSAAESWHAEHDKVVAFADKRKEKLDEAMRTITCLNNDIHELEKTLDGINEEKRMFGEEIDRLRRVVTELQTNRSLTNEIHEMLYKYLTTVNIPSADK